VSFNIKEESAALADYLSYITFITAGVITCPLWLPFYWLWKFVCWMIPLPPRPPVNLYDAAEWERVWKARH
jgi:hypothetical protein